MLEFVSKAWGKFKKLFRKPSQAATAKGASAATNVAGDASSAATASGRGSAISAAGDVAQQTTMVQVVADVAEVVRDKDAREDQLRSRILRLESLVGALRDMATAGLTPEQESVVGQAMTAGMYSFAMGVLVDSVRASVGHSRPKLTMPDRLVENFLALQPNPAFFGGETDEDVAVEARRLLDIKAVTLESDFVEELGKFTSAMHEAMVVHLSGTSVEGHGRPFLLERAGADA